ncbi:MAG: aminotransferase class V-fold PLP-dependent enzyme [Thermosynechococcaceae cyanobacterium]
MREVFSSDCPLDFHRQGFPALGSKRYFNYGGQGPLPQVALDAIVAGYAIMQQKGPFSKQVLDWVTGQMADTRAAIASELGVSPHTIALTDSVSTGCNIVLWGLPWQLGDHILLTDCEHPGIVAAVQELSRRFGVGVDHCILQTTLNTGDPVAAIAEAVTPQTRLVVLSHILWNTGQVLPLADIVVACRRQNPNVLLLVDAAQSVGVLPLDLKTLDIDFYAFTGHKWLCGPDGVGGLYLRPGLEEALSPTFIGWRGIRTDPTGTPIGWKPDGSKFEVATSAFPLYGGLTAAIGLHTAWGTMVQRYERICQLSGQLWSHLQAIKGLHCLRTAPPEAGLVSFQIPGRSQGQCVQDLEVQQTMVRLIADPNCIRACVHYLTLETEVEQLADQVAAWVEGQRN